MFKYIMNNKFIKLRKKYNFVILYLKHTRIFHKVYKYLFLKTILLLSRTARTLSTAKTLFISFTENNFTLYYNCYQQGNLFFKDIFKYLTALALFLLSKWNDEYTLLPSFPRTCEINALTTGGSHPKTLKWHPCVNNLKTNGAQGKTVYALLHYKKPKTPL